MTNFQNKGHKPLTYPEPYRTLLRTLLYIQLAGCCFLIATDASDATFLKPVFFSLVSAAILCTLVAFVAGGGDILIPSGWPHRYYLGFTGACLLSLTTAIAAGPGLRQTATVLECLLILAVSELVLEPRETL